MKPLIFILTLFSLISCKKDVQFNSSEWKKGGVDWQITDTRENMVISLIESDTLIGLSKNDVINLLGKAEFEESHELKILVREKYSWNVDPDYVSYLIIEFDNNGEVKRCFLEK